MDTVAQRSFAGGELAPALYARVDVAKYATGLRTLRNFQVMRHGGAANRPGTMFVGEVSDSSKVVKLIPFIFNTSQTYVLEFGEYYMRVIQDGAHLTETAKTITGATKANPGVITIGTHGYATGDEVYINSVGGMTELNNRNFKVVRIDANTFSLTYMDGTTVDSSAFTTYTTGGTAAKIYEIATPYIEGDLSDLNHVQSADVITLVHPDYVPRELARSAHTSWTLNEVTFAPSISAPTNVTSDGAGATYSYKITAIATETHEESLPSTAGTSISKTSTMSWNAVTGAQEYNVYRAVNGVYGFVGVAGTTSFKDDDITPDTSDTPPTARDPFDSDKSTITGITQDDPAVVTSGSHPFSDGDEVYILNVVGMTEVNNTKYLVANKAANTFELTDSDGNNVDSTGYTAYGSAGDVYTTKLYPSTVTYFQQRLLFANVDSNIEKVWASRTGMYHNFTASSPLQDDDAITFTVAGRQVNEIRHLVDLGRLVALTAAGEWTAEGDDSGILKPTAINLRQHSYNGSSTLPPITIGKNALYLQARGSIVRDLGFDVAQDGYTGGDLTIFSAHLFDGYTMSDWAFQQVPHSILWIVRSDGSLIGLTYVREHQMVAWHRHDFEGGAIENVVVIPEGDEDMLYVVIKRTIDGGTKRYVERLSTRRIGDVEDLTFLDSHLTYDGTNSSSATMTLTSTGTWLYTDTLTLTASSSTLLSTDIGNQIHLTGSDGDTIRFTITGYTSGTVVTGKPHKTVPSSLQTTAVTTWAKAVDELGGLWHLEGEDIAVFADGFVVASPNNASYTTVTVSGGIATLDKPYSVIHAGLPYVSDIETLDIDTPDGETLADKKKIVNRVTIFTENSRGVWVGPNPPSDDSTDPLEGLVELKLRNDESYDDPVDLTTGTMDVVIEGHWNQHGRVFIRQVDPIPLSVLAIMPSGMFPFVG